MKRNRGSLVMQFAEYSTIFGWQYVVHCRNPTRSHMTMTMKSKVRQCDFFVVCLFVLDRFSFSKKEQRGSEESRIKDENYIFHVDQDSNHAFQHAGGE